MPKILVKGDPKCVHHTHISPEGIEQCYKCPLVRDVKDILFSGGIKPGAKKKTRKHEEEEF